MASNKDWEEVPLSGSGWEEVPVSEGSISEMGSLGRGAAQGATLGFRDELAGAIESPLGAAKQAASYLGLDVSKDQDVAKYLKERNESRSLDEKAKKANPKSFTTGEIGGGIATALIPGLGTTSLARAATAGATYGAGTSKADGALDLAKDTALSGLIGGASYGLADKVVAPAISKGVELSKPYLSKASDTLRRTAGKLAEKATGATGKERAAFRPGAGEEMLDEGIVKAFYTPENIAARAEDVQLGADEMVGQALKELDEMGVTATPDKVMELLKKRADALRAKPGSAPNARAVDAAMEDVANSMGGKAQPLSEIESYKRSYKPAFKSQDENVRQGAKETYRGLRDVTEELATEANPDLAGIFKEGKRLSGLIEPLEEAATKRANQLNQMPWGGLLDVTSLGAGLMTDNEQAGVAFPIARRLLAPRAASTSAAAVNALSKAIKPGSAPINTGTISQIAAPIGPRTFPNDALKQVAEKENEAEIVKRPQSQYTPKEVLPKVSGSKYERPLSMAAQRGDSSFAATYYLLSQQDPEFRQLMGGELAR